MYHLLCVLFSITEAALVMRRALGEHHKRVRNMWLTVTKNCIYRRNRKPRSLERLPYSLPISISIASSLLRTFYFLPAEKVAKSALTEKLNNIRLEDVSGKDGKFEYWLKK